MADQQVGWTSVPSTRLQLYDVSVCVGACGFTISLERRVSQVPSAGIECVSVRVCVCVCGVRVGRGVCRRRR